MAEIQLIRLGKSFQARASQSLLDRLVEAFLGPRQVQAESRRSGGPKGAARGFEFKRLYLTIPDRTTMVILGPNGCGKSTLLRLIAGLLVPDEGEVRFDGRSMAGVPTQERRIGMVFENYALYPHFTSEENILSYFLFREKTRELDELAREKFQRTSELLGVDIELLLDRRPAQLSAGERQRVALGRCITRDPEVLLLDEPFANLDTKLRNQYRLDLKRLLQEYGVTTVYVTHDQEEARILGDRLAIMNIGTIEQVGTYEQIYRQPASRFVAEFLNLKEDTPAINLLPAGPVADEWASYQLGIRPEDLSLGRWPSALQFEAKIEQVSEDPLEDRLLVTASVGAERVVFELKGSNGPARGDRVTLQAARGHLFRSGTGRWERTIEGHA